MIKISRTIVGLTLAAAVTLASSPALAEPPPTPPADPTQDQLDRAKVLFGNGKELYKEGSYEAAIAAFKTAYGQSGDAVLLYNIALAYDRAEMFDEALEYLEYYRAYAPESERDTLAEKEDSLRKRQLRAQTEDNGEKDTTDTSNEDDPGDDTTAPPDPRTAVSPEDDGTAAGDDKPKLFTPAVWVFSGVAIVGLGVGTGLGVVALNRRRDAESGCMDDGSGTAACPMSAEDDANSARRLGIGADVAFGIGAVSGVVAIALLINNAVKRKKASGTTAFVPTRGGAGLSVRF